MARTTQTFEDVDKIVRSADLKRFRAGGSHHVTARSAAVAPGDVLEKLCAIWKVAGPIIRLVIKTPFIPSSWRAALEILANLMDTVCKNA